MQVTHHFLFFPASGPDDGIVMPLLTSSAAAISIDFQCRQPHFSLEKNFSCATNRVCKSVVSSHTMILRLIYAAHYGKATAL